MSTGSAGSAPPVQAGLSQAAFKSVLEDGLRSGWPAELASEFDSRRSGDILAVWAEMRLRDSIDGMSLRRLVAGRKRAPAADVADVFWAVRGRFARAISQLPTSTAIRLEHLFVCQAMPAPIRCKLRGLAGVSFAAGKGSPLPSDGLVPLPQLLAVAVVPVDKLSPGDRLVTSFEVKLSPLVLQRELGRLSVGIERAWRKSLNANLGSSPSGSRFSLQEEGLVREALAVLTEMEFVGLVGAPAAEVLWPEVLVGTADPYHTFDIAPDSALLQMDALISVRHWLSQGAPATFDAVPGLPGLLLPHRQVLQRSKLLNWADLAAAVGQVAQRLLEDQHVARMRRVGGYHVVPLAYVQASANMTEYAVAHVPSSLRGRKRCVGTELAYEACYARPQVVGLRSLRGACREIDFDLSIRW